jgi:hypothetical protein
MSKADRSEPRMADDRPCSTEYIALHMVSLPATTNHLDYSSKSVNNNVGH